ncbi:MAG: MFS transporter [Candidatus Bipolaricaulota bacterium]|nr:MFS transporter [Candidatus Bipolaricaulota bacterium]
MKTKILYSSGSFATTLVYQTFTTLVIFFYVDTLKLDPGLVGLGWAFYGIWNAVNDPLAGYIGDRTRTRWGRRIPYIACGAVPLAISFALLWSPPVPAESGWALFGYFLLIIFCFDTLWTLVALNYTALFPEMFVTVADRAHVSAWRQVFNVLGVFCAMGLSPVIYSFWGWAALGWLYGLLTAAVLFLTVAVSQERPEFGREQPLKLSEALRATIVNRAFGAFIGTLICIWLAFQMIQATLPFFAAYVLQIPKDEPMKLSALLALPLIIVLPTLPWWRHAAVRWGAATALAWAIVLFALALIPLWFVQDFLGAVIALGLLGVGLGGLWLLPDLLIADIIDEDELTTGVRREGLYFGMNGLLIRFAFTLQGLIMGAIFRWSGYQPDHAQQTPEALWGLRLLIAGVPLVALGVGWMILRWYDLTGERLALMKEQLERLHAQKTERLAKL